MNFLIADTFTASLGRLNGQEQKAVKTSAFDLQLNPTASGLSMHKLDRAQDKNFWSVRVNLDIRIIIHKTQTSLLLAYVDHHDAAYAWANRRKLERHPTTGAMQLVELVAMVEGTESDPIAKEAKRWAVSPDPDEHPLFRPQELTPSGYFAPLSDEDLLRYGVPPEWIMPVRQASEDALLETLTHLPQEAQEALLKLAVGEKPEPLQPIPQEADPFTHPDAQRRFRIMTNSDELRLALDSPWDKWTIFLHPSQTDIATKTFSGPARVAGSAGTGKTVLALHRTVNLARENPNARLLLTTFSKALANALRRKLALLTGDQPGLQERITVDALNNVAHDLYSERFGQPNIASASTVRAILLKSASAVPGHKFDVPFLLSEWTEIIDAWQLRTWEAYRDVTRLGRKTRVGGKQREVLWQIFETCRHGLVERKLVTWADVFERITPTVDGATTRPFDFIMVDECQDLSVAQARFLAAIGGRRENALFFGGDLGQRIFQQPFSWKSLGLDVRGRSATLRINYRTSHQIRTQADLLLPSSISDVDGLTEDRRGTISLFDGPAPIILLARSNEDEQVLVGDWIKARIDEGMNPGEIAIFVRSEAELKRARAAVKLAGLTADELTEKSDAAAGCVAISTMHLAKGHEFKAVVVMACDEDVIPLQERMEAVGDEAELEEVYTSERHLFYVAITRARDFLIVTGVTPGSEFMGDLRPGSRQKIT